MRIGVIGAGAIGGTIAALLDRAGHEVEVTARGATLDVLRSDGLHLTGAWGEHTAHPLVSPRLVREAELVLVCTKANDAREAIIANRDRMAEGRVVIVQNGLRGLADATELLPGTECVGALAIFAATLRPGGSVEVTTAANTYLGSGAGAPTTAAAETARVLNEALPTIATSNFVGSQWTKLMINQVNALPAITGLFVQNTIADRRLRRILTASMREAVRVGMRRGIRFGSLQGLNNGVLQAFARSPRGIGQLVPLLIARRMGDAPNPGSTLQSIRRGQRSEIDYLNGAVVDEAASIGLRAPINAELVELVHLVEDAGRFVPVDEVVRRIAAASPRR